jgi:toxin FitB
VTRYLLDTNVISELRKIKPHGAVLAWLGSLRSEQILISAATLGELQAGVERTRRQNAAKASEIEAWLNEVEESYAFLPMDASCFREWSRLMEGQAQSLAMDAIIAATARKYGLTVATRNEKDFRQLGVEMVNPFKFN